MTLATQADVEKLLQVDFGDDPDASVAQYLAQADAMIEAYCGQPLTFDAVVTETFEGPDTTETKVLGRFPISAVASVVENGETLTETTEYLWYPDGRIRRVAGNVPWLWSDLLDANVVTYSAGYGAGATAPYDEVPDALVLVAAGLAAALFRHGAMWAAHGTKGPVKSISLDGSDAVTYDTSQANAESPDSSAPELSAGQKTLLAPYRRRGM